MFRSTASRMMRLQKRHGTVRLDDPYHGHFGARYRDQSTDPWIEHCHGCQRRWDELKAADFLPRCKHDGLQLFCHWADEDGETGTWPLNADDPAIVDIDRELEVNVVEREIHLQWSDGNLGGKRPYPSYGRTDASIPEAGRGLDIDGGDRRSEDFQEDLEIPLKGRTGETPQDVLRPTDNGVVLEGLRDESGLPFPPPVSEADAEEANRRAYLARLIKEGRC